MPPLSHCLREALAKKFLADVLFNKFDVIHGYPAYITPSIELTIVISAPVCSGISLKSDAIPSLTSFSFWCSGAFSITACFASAHSFMAEDRRDKISS